MPIGHEAISLGDVSYYDIGGSVDNIDTDTLARTLGPSNKVRKHYARAATGSDRSRPFCA